MYYFLLNSTGYTNKVKNLSLQKYLRVIMFPSKTFFGYCKKSLVLGRGNLHHKRFSKIIKTQKCNF